MGELHHLLLLNVDLMDLAAAAVVYFHMGLSYYEIIWALAQNHRIIISLRTMKRFFKTQSLYRRKHHSDIVDVEVFINDQIGSGCQPGYR